ncbi:MAG: hypothetical protein IIV80_03730 [Clostridia bacterium]|nr:hypothetical protein [Clostridia bacterium]
MITRIKTLLLAALLLAASMTFLPSCGRGPAPTVDSVYDRIVYLVQTAEEVNTVLFGAGLPIYPRGDAEDNLLHRYYGVNDDGFAYVTRYAAFSRIDDMKEAAAHVYSREYCESVLEAVFTGYRDKDTSASLPARYREDEKALWQNGYVDSLVSGVRSYDFAAMKIVKGSHSRYIKVEIPSRTDDKPDEWVTVRLSLVLEDGQWFLDSPSC